MKGFIKVISGLKSGIVRRLIIYILLFSLVITFIGTGLQLYLDFNRGIKSIHTTFKQVESSYKNSIVNSLWVTDDELLSIQMEGILQLPDIQFIEIRKGAEVLQAAGTPQSGNTIEHTVPLVYVYNGKDVHLGDIHIVASLKGVYSRIFDRILIILSMQTINIFLVSLFIFIFFYQLVGKHIISMASFAESIRFDSKDQIFQLDRKLKTKKPDELEQLVTSFNLMRKNLARDINRREIAEKELRKSEERYQSLYDDAPDMYVSVSSQDASILQCNKTLLDKTGYSREEVIGSPIYKMYHDDCMEDVKRAFQQFTKKGIIKDKELILKSWDKMVKSKGSWGLEYRFVDKEGKVTWVYGTASPIYDEVGEISAYIGINTDITERKLAEQELRESNEKYLNLMNSLGTGVVLHAPDISIVLSNPMASEILGISIEQMKGKKAIDPRWRFVRNDGTDMPLEEYPVNKALKSMKSFSDYFIGIKRPDREYITWVDVNASFVFDENKNIKYVTISFNDKTEQKKSEQALKESEEKLNLIINSSPIGICTVDQLGNFLTTNPAYEQMVGYSKEECRSLSFFDITHPNDRPKNKKLYQSMFSLETTGFSMKKRYLRKDGSEIDVAVHAIGIMNAEGNVRFGTAFVDDITERKRAEESLKESEEKFKKIFELSPVIITLTDIETGVYLDVNEMFSSKLGFTREEVIGTKSTDLDLFMSPSAREDIIRLFNEQGFILNHEFQLRRKSGSIFHSIFSSYIIKLKNKKVMLTTAVDITDRKQVEIALKESEAKLNALFTSLTEMVVMHDLVLNTSGEAIDYRIIDCNKVFTEITGIPKEDAIGKLASQVYQTNPPPYLEKFAKVALGGDAHEFNTYYAPLDKHLMISVVSPQAGKFATITTDISDMMQIQEMILAKNKEMENYLYVTSHDLRSPLVNIQGFSQRLKKQADSIKTLFADKTLEPETLHQLGNITDEDIPKTLSFILSNIEKMDTLINGLLQLSRTGRIGMNIQKIDMNALFAKILHSLDFQIKEAQCKIHISPLPECYGDATLLDQLFENIISNALKYSDQERALEITVDAKKIYNRVIYTIRDTGKGITQKHLDKIWDVFYRIDPRSGKSGEGIGLSLVKRIAEKHKGKVWAESEENRGSVFNIELHNRIFTEL